MATFKSHKGKTVCVNGSLVSFRTDTIDTECEATIKALSNALGVVEEKKPTSKNDSKNKAG